MTHPIRFFLLPLVACGLVACSGDDSSVATVGGINLDQALKTWVAQGQSAGLRGSGACQGTLVYVQQPAATQQNFAGNTALAATVTRTSLLKAGCTYASGISTGSEFYTASYLPLGRSKVGEYGIYATPPVFPTAAKTGDTGAVGVLQLYTDANKQTALGREEVSYLVEASAQNATDALVSFTSKRYDAANKLQLTSKLQYSLPNKGALSLVSAQFNDELFAN